MNEYEIRHVHASEQLALLIHELEWLSSLDATFKPDLAAAQKLQGQFDKHLRAHGRWRPELRVTTRVPS